MLLWRPLRRGRHFVDDFDPVFRLDAEDDHDDDDDDPVAPHDLQRTWIHAKKSVRRKRNTRMMMRMEQP